MSTSAPMRGLRLMRLGVMLMLVSYALELVLAVMAMRIETEAGLLSALAWTGRLHLLSLVVVALLAAGVIGNLAELRRRRRSTTAAMVAMAALLVALAVRGWLYGLLGDVTTALETGARTERVDDLALVPRRVFYGTAAYAVGLIAIVRLLRQYALSVDDLSQREQARTLAGMLALLLLADTFYRFTYGLGGDVSVFGVLGLVGAIGLFLFWVWCHRRLGALIEHTMYTLSHSSEFPTAEVVAAPAPRRAAPTGVPAPVTVPVPAPAPLAPAPTAAPTETPPASLSRGPRFLRDRDPSDRGPGPDAE